MFGGNPDYWFGSSRPIGPVYQDLKLTRVADAVVGGNPQSGVIRDVGDRLVQPEPRSTAPWES